jgi:hypothetical protein
LGKWQYLAIIIAFTLLLTAGLDYTGRNMYHALGGDKTCYAFLLPDLVDSQVVFCGRAYADYQVENLWDRWRTVLNELLQAAPPALLKQILLFLKGRLLPIPLPSS